MKKLIVIFCLLILSLPWAYTFVDAGTPVSIAVSAGNNQSVFVDHAFPLPLSVIMLDCSSAPVSGVEVTFTAPASGAGGTFENSGTNVDTAVTGMDGVATSSAFITNHSAGSYDVSATMEGAAGPATFTMDNKGLFFLPMISTPLDLEKDFPKNGDVDIDINTLFTWIDISNQNRYYKFCVDTIDDGVCNTSWQPTSEMYGNVSNLLSPKTTYYWQVRAIDTEETITYADYGDWWSFTTNMPPKAGFYRDSDTKTYFYVTPDRTSVTNFSFYVSLSGCFEGWITSSFDIPITQDNFQYHFSQFGMPYNFRGFFDTETTANGQAALWNYEQCGQYWSTPYIYWNAIWIDASQPDSLSPWR